MTKLLELKEEYYERIEKSYELIISTLDSDAKQIAKTIDFLQHAKGKGLRPLLSFFFSDTFGCDYESSVKTAAIVEAIHFASIIHDDVIDSCALRREKPTLNAQLGEGTAILLGDHTFVSIYQIAATLNLSVVQEVSKTIKMMIAGELKQQESSFTQDNPLESYFSVLRGKTAALLNLCALIPANIIGISEGKKSMALNFTENFGLAFQIADDWSDFMLAGKTSDKDRGVDIANGFVTLPWIYLYESADTQEQQLLEDIFANAQICGFSNPDIVLMVKKYSIEQKVTDTVLQLLDQAEKEMNFIGDDTKMLSVLSAIIREKFTHYVTV